MVFSRSLLSVSTMRYKYLTLNLKSKLTHCLRKYNGLSQSNFFTKQNTIKELIIICQLFANIQSINKTQL